MKRKNFLFVISAALVLSLTTSTSFAKKYHHNKADLKYQVTITNITKSTIFTPILVASHQQGVKLFQVGQPASHQIERVAEGGDIMPLTMMLEANNHVADVQNSGAPLLPGASVTVEVKAKRGANRISVISMLLPTNDAFFALNGVRAPRHPHKSTMYRALAYDAGTEANDELCAHIPGPQCGGIPFSDPDKSDEGYIYISNGIHGVGDLSAAMYDWNNPVATITIKLVK